MLDRVVGIGNAVRHRLVGNIDGIVVLDKHVGNPDDIARHPLVACGFGHLEGSHAERILAVLVAFMPVCKADTAIEPMVLADALFVATAVHDEVIVDDDFLLLPVAFSRSEDNGSGILEHRYKIRYDKSLGEHVLGGTEEARTLPHPFLLGMIVVFAVALANAEMPAL